MSKMLLSIKPEYVKKIFSGKKTYEFRKFRCKDGIQTLIIYSTAPEKKVVGEAVIEEVLEGDLEKIWQWTKESSGLTKKAYRAYYDGREVAVAYKLTQIVKYDEPKALSDFGLNYVPQSFAYVEE